MLAPDVEWHLFISHVWSTGQDSARVIKERLRHLVPGIECFLDVDNLDDISRLEDYVAALPAEMNELQAELGEMMSEQLTLDDAPFRPLRCMAAHRARAARLARLARWAASGAAAKRERARTHTHAHMTPTLTHGATTPPRR